MACGVFLYGLFFIVLSSLSPARNGGVKALDSWLWQPQRFVSVAIGDILHLKCEVFDNFTPGPVKWFLVEEPEWKLIYQDIQTNEADERITRDYPNSNTDFTISIRNVTLEDAGTYCCVKEKRDMRGSEVILGGRGTQVVVEGIKGPDSWLSQPQRSVSVMIGGVLHLECRVQDSHTPGAVKWFLGEGRQRKLVYVDTKTDERITRNSPGSNTDFTISIRNVTPEDAGTYYCMKEKKNIRGDKDWLKGHGTLVVVEGIKGPDSWLLQPQRSVSVVIGGVLHLECRVQDSHTPGAVKWFLGEGRQRKLVYVDTKTEERITRNSPGSNTDFTISIRNVTPEDAGTYYCMKEKKNIRGDKDWLKGHGTLVVVEGLQGQSIYGLYLGLFLNKVAMILFLLGLFQIKQHGCCLAR